MGVIPSHMGDMCLCGGQSKVGSETAKTKAATQNYCIGQDPLPQEMSNIRWLRAGAPHHQ